ncbi:hypothetical protein C8F04DRAFT_1074525 [Mycena alexandri]|uniref:Uncharacterized protein n=1 Tax=Mycena alexandri TaxID=1745969 RepID=A0AAD6TCW2_9AGAR|nr:hypothetical protein C8F04DRAFT_1074525 [Mycena alexandri]
MRWPALVILGQLCLQGLGWGFLAVVKYQGPLALPHAFASWVADNPHLVTLIATLISTLLAGCSSFFFSYALRRSMSLYLLRPMSLAALGASVNISMRSLVFHRRNWKWPAVSLLCFIMAGIQTSVWSTLITPVKVTISTPLVGREIDLASPILQQLILNDPQTLAVCQAAENGTEVYGGVPESGYASGQSYLGLPAAVSLLGKGFNVSTRGILAASLNDTVVGSWFVPATAQSLDPRLKGISDNYSMVQQGFSADVSCSLETLSNDTSLAVWAEYDYVESWHANVVAQSNITYVIAFSNCTTSDNAMNITDAYTKDGPDAAYLWAIGCDPVAAAPNNYTLIMQASGNYSELSGSVDTSYLVCQISPKMTVINAEYDGEVNSIVQSVNGTSVDGGGAAGKFAMYIITDLVWHQQGLTVNGVAEQLLELSKTVGDDQRFQVVEQYLQGVVEYSGSILRACLSARDLAFNGGVPTNITNPTSGTWNTETMGWKGFSAGTTLWILVPSIFMATSTLALVMVALYRHGGEMLHGEAHSFDPSNPLHLIAVAAAGGLQNVFKGFRDKDINEGAKLNVVMGVVPGRGPALVRADEYVSESVHLDAFAPEVPLLSR